MTKVTAVHAAPEGAPCPLWTAFLVRITSGNPELMGFLKRWCGYCLTGHVSERVFTFLFGTGAKGKGTFINTIASVLGDYAAVVPMDLLMASNNERHPTEMAKLCGVRLAIAHETQQGRRWDEAKLKTLTGGDKLTARFMRQDFFDFTLTHKFMISGNHKPSLTGVDEAIRRRLLLVPFTVQIPPEERDPALSEKLKAEWPAILRWMIEVASNGAAMDSRCLPSFGRQAMPISLSRMSWGSGWTSARSKMPTPSHGRVTCSITGASGARKRTCRPAVKRRYRRRL
jgi:putative DNA primase/helicase